MISHRMSFVLVALVFVTLAVIYSLATPIFEAPDESYHFFVIQHIREGQGLPVQGAPGESLYAQEGSQPPLYYLAGAALTSAIDTRDARNHLRENPQANLGDPANPGNKNRYIHTDREAFPFHGAPLAVHVLRLFSIALGLIVVVCVYATARIVFPNSPGLAVFGAAVVAFTPQFIFISASVNNDNAINALAATNLYLLARAWQGDRSLRHTIGLACVIGLALIAKLGGLILLGYSIVVLVYLAWARREFAWGVRSVAAIVFGAALIGGWWYFRNLQLYGDPTGLNAMFAVVGRRALGLPELFAELQGLWLSVWGVFGWFNLLLPDLVYTIYALLSAGALLGGLIALTRLPVTRRQAEPVAALLLWSVLVVFAVLRWTAMTLGSQGRLLFPAAPALAILAAAGLWNLRPRWGPAAGGVLAVTMLAIAAWTPFGVIAPAYARPARIALDDVPHAVAALNLDFNGEIRLIGGLVEPDDVHPPDTLRVTLYWQALKKPAREYMVAIDLLGRELELVGSEDAYHGAGTYPSDLWQAGEVLADRYEIRLSESARAPTRVRVEVALRDRSTRQPVIVAAPNGQPFAGSIFVDEFRLRPIAADLPTPEVSNALDFGGVIRLRGYTLKTSTSPTRRVELALCWAAAHRPPDDYTVFIHLLDAKDEIVAQWDAQPLGGDYPTTWWQPGERIWDERALPLPTDLPSGDYRLAIGLYHAPDGPRLPVRDESGSSLPDDRLLIDVRAP
jgi:hypothetical protein